MWKQNRKRRIRLDDAMSWGSVGLLIVLAIVFVRRGVTGNWFAAAAWTVLALMPAVSINRRKWSSAAFWGRWAICAVVHGLGMFLIFGVLIPKTMQISSIVIVPGSIEALAISIWAGAKRVPPQAAQDGDRSGVH